MSHSPPAAKPGGRRSAAAGGSSRKKGAGKKKGSTKTKAPLVDLTTWERFGFTKTGTKKRPAPVDTTAANDGGVEVVEVVTSPAKRARTPTSAAAAAATVSRGSGKENPASGTNPAAVAASATSSAATPAKKGEDGGRVALLDLTGDSGASENSAKSVNSSNSAKKPAAKNATAKAPASANATAKATAAAAATATLGGMGDAMADAIRAASKTNPTGDSKNAAANNATSAAAGAQRQRRGKRDKQPPGSAAKRPGTEAPIPIFEDHDPANKSQKSSPRSPPKFAAGALVDVQSRTWPGRNDSGGVARITTLHPASNFDDGINRYDVRYVIGTRREKLVEEHYVKGHEESPGKRRVKETPKARENAAARSQAKRRSNSPTKRKSPPATSPAKGKAEGKKRRAGTPSPARSIQSYFSPSKASPPGKVVIKMGDSPSKKFGNGPTKKGSADRKEEASPEEVVGSAAKEKLTPSQASWKHTRYHALALVPVDHHGQLAVSRAVAAARARPFDPTTNAYVTHRGGAHPDDAPRPARIGPGAILGRPSANKTKPNFVDIGIPKGSHGISRTHAAIVSVEGLVAPGQSPIPPEGKAPPPTLRIRSTHPQGIHLFFAVGGERTTLHLREGEEKKLRVGDVIGFSQNYDHTQFWFYCIVGLVFPSDDVDAARALAFPSPQEANGERTSPAKTRGETIEIDEEERDDRKASSKKGPVSVGKFTPATGGDIVAAAASTARAMASSPPTESPAKLPPLDADAMVEEVVEDAEPNHLDGKKLAVAPKLAGGAGKGSELSMSQDAAMEDETQSIDDFPLATLKKHDVIESFEKGDIVMAFYDLNDMFGEKRKEGYLGTVVSVKKPAGSTVTVRFDDGSPDEEIDEDIEKVKDPFSLYPNEFRAGDVVDALYQDGNTSMEQKWWRGRIADVREKTCDVYYYNGAGDNGEYESNIPSTEKKIRLIHRDDGDSWLLGKSATLKLSNVDDENDTGFRTGVVTREGNSYRIKLSDSRDDGDSTMTVSYEEAARAVLFCKRKDLDLSMQQLWPTSSTASAAETARLRRQRSKEQKQASVKTEAKPEPKRPSRKGKSAKSSETKKKVKEEPIDEEAEVDAMDEDILLDDNGHMFESEEMLLPIEGGPEVDPSILENRKVAKDFPAGLPNVLWCALNSPEPRTGYNFLCDLLAVHDSVPPTNTVSKLMELMKYGPRAEGSSSVYFKDPNRTELASSYVYSLVEASRRFVRRGDAPALFGPSSWDDIEVLLSQSIAQTGNAISGWRLAHGLQLAARGAKLMEVMLKTELQGHDLFSTPDDGDLDSEAIKGMPTVRLMKSYGARSALKSTVGHATRCLVRHSRWILDQSGDSPRGPNDECCSLEARACLESLGSAVCTVSWLYCAEEGVDIAANPTDCAFVIKDEFLAQMERSLGELPDMRSKRAKDKFVKRLKMYFVLSLSEEFAVPLVASLAKMIGVDEY